ncbi:hypothetical protein U9M48_027661 [Paspalum notatum var. saurae]|uniref:Transposase n=1 Tax=Paspalum notatum var. saurae TaxID=547442 RepID=A0AAQ3TZW1_PASNO
MEADAKEEARADAELAADPMMDRAETGRLSSSASTIRFRKTVSIRPRCNPADRSELERGGLGGVGHRTPVNAALGAFCRFYYPGMVTLPNGDQVAAHKWEHWGLKQHVDGDGQGEQYRLDGEGDYENEKMVKRVFQKAATKVVRDSFSNARIQAIVNFHKRVKNINMKKNSEVKKLHLEEEELIQGEIDWIMKDPEAWRWICHHWAGSDFQGHRIETEVTEPVSQGCKVNVTNFALQEAKSGIKPSFVDVYIEGHKGLDPENPEVLCDEQVTEKLAEYKGNVIQRHGPEFDWRAAAPDVEAIYHAGGGLPHGRWGLGDGTLEYDHIPRPQRTSQVSSSRRPSRAQQEAQQEETRKLQEETRRLRENNDYMMVYLVQHPAIATFLPLCDRAMSAYSTFPLHRLCSSIASALGARLMRQYRCRPARPYRRALLHCRQQEPIRL